MKKLILGLVLAAMGLFAMSSVASAASIQEPVGTRVTATGYVNFAGNILTARCSMNLAGEVTGRDTLDVTGGSGSCNVGGLTLTSFPWGLTFDAFGPGTWELTGMRAVVDVPVFGDCVYTGSLGGVYTSAGGVTDLTILDALSSVSKESGSFACTSTPEINGELRINPLTIL